MIQCALRTKNEHISAYSALGTDALFLYHDICGVALTINKSLSRIEGTDIVSSTKTASGERTLKIPNFVLNTLSERRQKQWNDRKILHEAYHENNLVCCRNDGSYYVFGSFTTKFSKHLNKIGMRHIRFHDLRHTNATLMLQYNVPIKVMSENLGHSNTGVTIPVPNSNTKPVAVHTDIHDEYKKVKRFSLVG